MSVFARAHALARWGDRVAQLRAAERPSGGQVASRNAKGRRAGEAVAETGAASTDRDRVHHGHESDLGGGRERPVTEALHVMSVHPLPLAIRRETPDAPCAPTRVEGEQPDT